MALTKDEILNTGRQVLAVEAAAVKNLADALDDNFVRAVRLLAQAKSRVIVTGIGKSGLVAHKSIILSFR